MHVEKKVFISFVEEEKELADKLEKYIKQTFPDDVNNKFDLIPCEIKKEWKDEELSKQLKNLPDGADKVIQIVLALCSPFSTAQPSFNFVVGAAVIHTVEEIAEKGKAEVRTEKKTQKTVTIIPICHSGQKSKDLPHYLMSRQAMEILYKTGEDLFEKKLIYSLFNKLELEKPLIKKYPEFNLPILGDLSKDNNHFEITKEEYSILSLQWLNDEELSFGSSFSKNKSIDILDEKSWAEKVTKMQNFLNDKNKSKIHDVEVAIGVQNCLFDGKDVYIGLRIDNIENTDFLTLAKGEFDTGYKLLEPSLVKKLSLDNLMGELNMFVLKDHSKGKKDSKNTDFLQHIKNRLKVLDNNISFAKLSVSGCKYDAIIFINYSRYLPRFEIGLLNYIDISQFKSDLNKQERELVPGFGEDKFPGCWIWVKEGKIFYWFFPDKKYIPRYISPPDEKTGKSGLISTHYFRKNYGRLEEYTPYASDEDITNINMVKNRFSSSARCLLSCF